MIIFLIPKHRFYYHFFPNCMEKLGVISWLLFHRIWKNYLLHWLKYELWIFSLVEKHHKTNLHALISCFCQLFVYIFLCLLFTFYQLFCSHRFEKLAIPIENGPDEQTGEEFSYQSSLPFTFKDEFQAIKTSKHTLLMKLPHLIPPRCTFKV